MYCDYREKKYLGTSSCVLCRACPYFRVSTIRDFIAHPDMFTSYMNTLEWKFSLNLLIPPLCIHHRHYTHIHYTVFHVIHHIEGMLHSISIAHMLRE